MSLLQTSLTWVDQTSALEPLARELKSQSRLAVDTESNSLHAYHEQVCLIQFSTAKADILVDPLNLRDLSALEPIFASPEIEKVFHAVEYDLICLKRDFGFEVNNIFDTMQSARILGYKQVGLDAMLGLKFGLEVDKRFQKADWAYRPLTEEMLSYARLDTHYLLALRDLLHLELINAGRWDLAREEFVRLARSNGNNRLDLPSWQRVSGTQQLDSRQLTILKELCIWRDKTAERLGRPAFKVMDDKRLVHLAIAAPVRASEAKGILTEYQGRRFGVEILRAVKRGLESPLVIRPRTLHPKRAILNRANILSQWRKKIAEKYHMESDIILPKGWMQVIAEQNPSTLEELENLMPDSPWRLEHFGEEILKAIH